jgi:hypothetical protein
VLLRVRTGSAAVAGAGGLVLGVGDLIQPGGLRAVVIGGGGVPQGEVLPEAVLGGAVPVLLAGRTGDGLAGVGGVDGAVALPIRAMPATTWRVWPTAWWCQAVRAPGAKCTMLARMREAAV